MVGIDKFYDWQDGLCFPGGQRFRLPNSAEGNELLVLANREMPRAIKIGFEATGSQDWLLWATLLAASVDVGQLLPAQIKAYALSRGTRAKKDRIDTSMNARFVLFRPNASRRLATEDLRILRALTTSGAHILDMRTRLSMQIAARRKQNIPADAEGKDAELMAMLASQISARLQRIESVIA